MQIYIQNKLGHITIQDITWVMIQKYGYFWFQSDKHDQSHLKGYSNILGIKIFNEDLLLTIINFRTKKVLQILLKLIHKYMGNKILVFVLS